MRRLLTKWTLCKTVLVALLGLAAPAAHAQEPSITPVGLPKCCVPPPICPCPPGAEGMAQPGQPGQAEQPNADLASLPERGGGAGIGSSAELSPGGYLDDAIPRTMFRLRYDNAQGMNRPDRAEYFYGAWQELSFHPHGVNHGGVFFDPNARGPDQLPSELSYQEPSAYIEYAFTKRFSAFADLPVRFVSFRGLQEDSPESEMKRNPADSPNPGSRFFPEPGPENAGEQKTYAAGVSDLQLGFKYAVIADPDRYLTFQFRTYVPTGDAGSGLGTGHVSLEPGLLLYQRLTDRLVFQGQLTDWIPVAGSAEEGNVLSYGVGLAYDVYRGCKFRVTPVAEVVGWTVLNGYESVFETISATAPPNLELPVTHGVEQAGGDTIVNLKFGVRTYFSNGQDLYVGYGHSVTGDRWYKDILRVEYRIGF